jgi:hypothetical protein
MTYNWSITRNQRFSWHICAGRERWREGDVE